MTVKRKSEIMANPEHVKILKQGAETWNKWREENPEVKPNLREAYLRDAQLRDANLSGADLGGADLGWANLRNINLTWANLTRTWPAPRKLIHSLC
jgi:hypothetical protein